MLRVASVSLFPCRAPGIPKLTLCKDACWKCLRRADEWWLKCRWSSNYKVRTMYKYQRESSTSKHLRQTCRYHSAESAPLHRFHSVLQSESDISETSGAARDSARENIPATALYLVIHGPRSYIITQEWSSSKDKTQPGHKKATRTTSNWLKQGEEKTETERNKECKENKSVCKDFYVFKREKTD